MLNQPISLLIIAIILKFSLWDSLYKSYSFLEEGTVMGRE